jgi:hypothetical protein
MHQKFRMLSSHRTLDTTTEGHLLADVEGWNLA